MAVLSVPVVLAAASLAIQKARAQLTWKNLLLLYILFNLKSVPFSWHVRLLQCKFPLVLLARIADILINIDSLVLSSTQPNSSEKTHLSKPEIKRREQARTRPPNIRPVQHNEQDDAMGD